MTNNFIETKDLNSRINATWFYPKISKFLNEIDNSNTFLDSNLSIKPTDNKICYLYIHIPYCDSFCSYCACFKELKSRYSREDREILINNYLKELDRYFTSNLLNNIEIGYISFGGGTPSCLDIDLICKILDYIHTKLNLRKLKGISFEGNVMTLKSIELLQRLKDYGISRLSFGLQTTNLEIRKFLNIKAKLSDIDEAVNNIKKIGFKSFSADVIYNLPLQNENILHEDLDFVVNKIQPDTIQTYQFNAFHNTKLYDKIYNRDINDIPTMEKEITMYEYILDYFMANGYSKQLFINLFSKDNLIMDNIGIEHSLGNNTFDSTFMIGIGPGAMSYIGNSCFKNYPSIKDYNQSFTNNGFPIESGNYVLREELENKVMVFFPNFTYIDKANIPNRKDISNKIKYLLDNNFICDDCQYYKLTRKGKIWAGNISYFFYSDTEKLRIKQSFYASLKNNVNPFNQDKMNISREK